MQRPIDLPDDQVQGLEPVAADERRTVDDLVQQAVGDYLARRRRDWSHWGVAGVRSTPTFSRASHRM